MFTESDVIHTYTRAQAIEDGVLVDVSEMACQAGFTCPVSVTTEVWAKIEDIPPDLRVCQDVRGRLWDVLHMLRVSARASENRDRDTIRYSMIMDRNEGGRRLRYLDLKAVVGAGDDLEAVVTIMLPR